MAIAQHRCQGRSQFQGMPMRDALYILENKGFRVTFKGSGKVVEQSFPPGSNKSGSKQSF